MLSSAIKIEYIQFTQSLFSIGEWLGDGLILGLRWDPDRDIWLYQLEASEIEVKPWIPESELKRE